MKRLISNRKKHKSLLKNDDERLSKTRFIWLYSEDKLPQGHLSTLSKLRDSDLLTAKAWAMKEDLHHLGTMKDKATAKTDLITWIAWVKDSRITAMIKATEKIERHIDNILSYCDLPVNNRLAEGLNSQIMVVKQRVGGFRNIDNFKTAIYFYCGKLNLSP